MSSAETTPLREMARGPVVRSDRQLVWVLIAIAAFDVSAVAYSNVVHVRSGLGLFEFEFAIYAVAVLIQALPLLRARFSADRLYSVAGMLWLLATVSVFIVWNLVIVVIGIGISLLTRWQIFSEPYTLDVMAALGLAPLLFAVWALDRKVRLIEH